MNADLTDWHGFFIKFIRENPFDPCLSASYSPKFSEVYGKYLQRTKNARRFDFGGGIGNADALESGEGSAPA